MVCGLGFGIWGWGFGNDGSACSMQLEARVPCKKKVVSRALRMRNPDPPAPARTCFCVLFPCSWEAEGWRSTVNVQWFGKFAGGLKPETLCGTKSPARSAGVSAMDRTSDLDEATWLQTVASWALHVVRASSPSRVTCCGLSCSRIRHDLHYRVGVGDDWP